MKLKSKLVILLVFFFTVLGGGLAIHRSMSAYAQSGPQGESGKPAAAAAAPAAACTKNNYFFFMPPWYEYLTLQNNNGDCTVQFKVPGDFLAVGLAILDMLIRLAGFIAVISVIVSGVGYMSAGGNAEKAASARRRIYNSLIGLGIVLIATRLIAYLGHTLG